MGNAPFEALENSSGTKPSWWTFKTPLGGFEGAEWGVIQVRRGLHAVGSGSPSGPPRSPTIGSDAQRSAAIAEPVRGGRRAGPRRSQSGRQRRIAGSNRSSAPRSSPGCHDPDADAGGGTRTPKGVSPPAPKAGASANFATPARLTEILSVRLAAPDRRHGQGRERSACRGRSGWSTHIRARSPDRSRPA